MNCLYITYDGLLDPLGQSQVLPYITSLASKGHTITVISYEKQDRSSDLVAALEKHLINYGIKWERLTFKKGKFQFFGRVISGVIAIWKNRLRYKYDIVHLRGFMPAAIYKASLLRTPFIYDIRAFIGEWIDIGKIKERTWLGRILISLDRRSVEGASGLVVLDKSGEKLIKEIYDIPSVPLKIIRTCTDTSIYFLKGNETSSQDNGIFRFVFLGGAIKPYRPDLALKFVYELIKHGYNCHVDFINERDHEQIYSAAKEVNFPLDQISVYKLENSCIPSVLPQFDCGLIFNNPSRWRRVSSPTKFGEYLAAGLHTVALNGISVLEEFAESTNCVDLVSQQDLYGGLPTHKIGQIVTHIRDPRRRNRCKKLAKREFSLDKANKLYAELYSEIEVQIQK